MPLYSYVGIETGDVAQAESEQYKASEVISRISGTKVTALLSHISAVENEKFRTLRF